MASLQHCQRSSTAEPVGPWAGAPALPDRVCEPHLRLALGSRPQRGQRAIAHRHLTEDRQAAVAHSDSGGGKANPAGQEGDRGGRQLWVAATCAACKCPLPPSTPAAPLQAGRQAAQQRQIWLVVARHHSLHQGALQAVGRQAGVQALQRRAGTCAPGPVQRTVPGRAPPLSADGSQRCSPPGAHLGGSVHLAQVHHLHLLALRFG